ncbi:hypothetical protein J6590_037331 [Homalodisca vitripennis]|nr:hypothetical protein J6590_037331 [Homalodisca vitripennis]
MYRAPLSCRRLAADPVISPEKLQNKTVSASDKSECREGTPRYSLSMLAKVGLSPGLIRIYHFL